MKTLRLTIISIIIVLAVVFLPQSHANEWGPLPSSYPENKTIVLSFSYLSKGQSTNGTEGSIHIKLFDARTGLPIKYAAFWMNVKRGDSQVMNSRFYTYSGTLTLNLQHGSDYQWTEAPDHDPIFIGGFESKSDTINVDVQPLAKDVMYYFEIELATFDEPKMILFKPSGIKFDAIINSTIPYNQTISSSTFDMRPLEQFKSGVLAKDVSCNQGLQLIFKAEDGSSACVTSNTASILVERGWAKEVVTQTSQNSTLPASFMPCDTPFPKSNTGIAVLYMPVNSSGKICVRYSNPDNTPYPIGITTFDANNIHQNATGITAWNDLGNNTISKGNSTVVYWIKANNQTGFYGMEFFCDDWNPLAVGYDGNSNMTADDFPFLRAPSPCPFEPYHVQIDSTTGIGIKYIPYP